MFRPALAAANLKLKNMASKRTTNDGLKFTVEQQPKVEILESHKAKVHESSWLLSICKIIVTGFIAVTLLCCVIATKLTLVAIGQQFNTTCTLSPNGCIKERQNETPYIMMVMIMMAPQFISFIRAAANSAFSKGEPWPSRKAIIWVTYFSIVFFL